MWNERKESIGGIDKLDRASGFVSDHVQGFRQDLVRALDLLAAEFSERHLLRVDLELDHRLLHLLDVENQ